ncbi:hypothetical protein A2U01_0117763, partial [Trifolium medium]|nr:hypothetical protein [Trifolium medium]
KHTHAPTASGPGTLRCFSNSYSIFRGSEANCLRG